MRAVRRPSHGLRGWRMWRAYAVLAPLMALWLVLILRLLQIQVLQSGKYRELAKSQNVSRRPKHALRGEILDRRFSPLATNRVAFSVGVDPQKLDRPKEAARKISAILNQPAAELLRRFMKANTFVSLGRKLDAEKVHRLRELGLQALVFDKEYQRIYPYGRTAAHVVGFTDIDNNGLAGVEFSFDAELRGEDGYAYVQRDALNGEFIDLGKPVVEPRDGKHLVLTIDYVYQTIVEEELSRAVKNFGAAGGCVAVIHPMTGEVLAMASQPSFDPNRFTEFAQNAYRNRAISDIFEPGSTFKIVTLSALFEDRVKEPDDIVFAENGVYRLASRTIRDHERYGWLTVADVLKNSSNIGTVKLGMELGDMRLFRFARAFGFGALTGIELPGETGGLLREPSRWSRFTPASVSIGYEVGVTALQMAMAYGAIANGGVLLKPVITAGTFAQLPREIPQPKPIAIRRVLSPETAARMRGLLERVVADGTGKEAAIAGLRIAGKTGTAKKPRPGGGGYSETDYVASFVGFYPVDRPELLIVVVVDTPRPVHWGGSVSAPTFRRILERILQMRADSSPLASKSQPDAGFTPGTPAVKVPDVIDRSAAAATAMLRGMGLRVRTEGEGRFVQMQVPAPGEVVAPKSRVHLTLYSPQRGQQVQMPDLVGRTVREAIAALGARGLAAAVYGQGIVVKQQPEPGVWLRTGKRAALYCRTQAAERLTLLD